MVRTRSEHLVAQRDAFHDRAVAGRGRDPDRLTNMPLMANGGTRGLYGRAERPLQRRLPTSAFGLGSSNGFGHGDCGELLRRVRSARRLG